MKFLKKQKGFTLIELLVVVSIIGVLATIILSSLNEARTKSKEARALQTMRQIETAIFDYIVFENGVVDNGEYSYDSNGNFFNASGNICGVVLAKYMEKLALPDAYCNAYGGDLNVRIDLQNGETYCTGYADLGETGNLNKRMFFNQETTYTINGQPAGGLGGGHCDL